MVDCHIRNLRDNFRIDEDTKYRILSPRELRRLEIFTASLNFLGMKIVWESACSRRGRKGPHPTWDQTDQTSGVARRTQVYVQGAGSAALEGGLVDRGEVASSAVAAAGGRVAGTVQDRQSDRWDLGRPACPLGRHTPALMHRINLGRTEFFHMRRERRGRVSLPSWSM